MSWRAVRPGRVKFLLEGRLPRETAELLDSEINAKVKPKFIWVGWHINRRICAVVSRTTASEIFQTGGNKMLSRLFGVQLAAFPQRYSRRVKTEQDQPGA